MARTLCLCLSLIACSVWAQTPGPTIPIGIELPRERLELPILVHGTPVPDTMAVGIDLVGATCPWTQETVQGRLVWVQRCTVPSPTP